MWAILSCKACLVAPRAKKQPMVTMTLAMTLKVSNNSSPITRPIREIMDALVLMA